VDLHHQGGERFLFHSSKLQLFSWINGDERGILKKLAEELPLGLINRSALESILAFVKEDQPLVSLPAYQGNWTIFEKLKQFRIAQDAN